MRPRPQLLVFRHGETAWSREGRHTGRTDVALTDRGRDEARAAARTLAGWQIDVASTSPLQRARELAALVRPACGVAIDDDLVERDDGLYQGESTAESRLRNPEWSVWTHEIIDEAGDGTAAGFAQDTSWRSSSLGGAGSRRSMGAGSRWRPPR